MENSTQDSNNSKKEEALLQNSEEDLVEIRKKKVVDFFRKNKALTFYVALAVIIIILLYINIQIRTSNMPGLKDITTGGWTLGPDLDPFLFLRYAKYIVEHGSLMANDTMRNVPLGFNTAEETRMLPYMIAWLYNFLHVFSANVSVEYAAVIFPVVMSLFTAIFFFLFVNKVFEGRGKKVAGIIAIIATAFLIVLPSLLQRTVAGIPEKESAGFAFLFAAFYFFIVAWKAKKVVNSIIFGLLTGAATASMGLIWGLWIMIFLSIGPATFVAFIFGKVGKRELIAYSSWIISCIMIVIPLTQRFTLMGILTSSTSGSAFMVWAIMIIYFIVFKTRIKGTKPIIYIKQKTRLPEEIISILIFLALLLLLLVASSKLSFLYHTVNDVLSSFSTPYVDRLSFTVAENRQPYFTEWAGSFGPVIKGIPLFFWLFFIGSIFLFYETVKNLSKKYKWILTIAYVIFLFGLIFSRYSSSGTFNGVNFISKTVYYGSMIFFLLVLIYVYYKCQKDNQKESLINTDFSYILMFLLFFITLVAARSAIRLLMVLSPIAAIIIAYFAVERSLKIDEKNSNKIAMTLLILFFVEILAIVFNLPGWIIIIAPIVALTITYFTIQEKGSDETKKVIALIVAGIILIASAYTLYNNYNIISQSAKSYVPYAYTFQWQKAMAWVRDSTPESAVFSHWWDYGYWVQSIGKRATVLDGGNAISYWNHLMGRHVLTGQSEAEAMEFMYTHNSSYLLIDSTEIGKYSAYSSIGSDVNYDRYSWIGTFLMNDQGIQETRNETIYLYQGGIGADQDITWNDNGNEITLPEGRAGIGGIFLPISKDSNDNNASLLRQPTSVFVYQGKQVRIPMRYIYYQGKKYDFGSGLNTALFIMPQIIQQGGGIAIKDIGAAFYLSEKNLNALWVRLYLLGEGENFKLVHNEPNLIIESLKSQGKDIGDFAYYGDILGPIKIWEVDFPVDIKDNPDYLKTNYPKELFVAKQAF